MKKTMIVALHYNRIGNGKQNIDYHPNVHTLIEASSDDDILITEDEDGNTLPDSEWQLLDSGDNVILTGRDEIEASTGVLDYDGEYDKWVVKNIEDCSDEELDALYNAYEDGNVYNEELADYIVEAHGMHRIHGIKFYRTNAEVFCSGEFAKSFSWDGFESDEDVKEAWQWFFSENNIDKRSIEDWIHKCTNRIYFN